MPVAESVGRRSRLDAALKDAVEGETITLAEMAEIWGVSKGRFVNIRNTIPQFPDAIGEGAHGTMLYPRLASLQKLREWETRDDEVEAGKSARLAAIMGIDAPTGALNISEMARASALRGEIEARMAAQGALVKLASVQATSSKVYELLTRRLSHLGAVIDPNGKMAPAVREAADKAGKSLLLSIYAEMKDMLSSHADAGHPRSGTNGSSPRRARSTRASRNR